MVNPRLPEIPIPLIFNDSSKRPHVDTSLPATPIHGNAVSGASMAPETAPCSGSHRRQQRPQQRHRMAAQGQPVRDIVLHHRLALAHRAELHGRARRCPRPPESPANSGKGSSPDRARAAHKRIPPPRPQAGKDIRLGQPRHAWPGRPRPVARHPRPPDSHCPAPRRSTAPPPRAIPLICRNPSRSASTALAVSSITLSQWLALMQGGSTTTPCFRASRTICAGRIKPHRLAVQQRAGKDAGMMLLDPGAGIDQQRKLRRMAFGKAIDPNPSICAKQRAAKSAG